MAFRYFIHGAQNLLQQLFVILVYVCGNRHFPLYMLEGHRIKNSETIISKTCKLFKARHKVILTGK